MSNNDNSNPNPNPENPPNQPPPITRQQLAKLANAFGRYLELSEQLSSPLVTPETERVKAEHAGLRSYISETLLSHAGEFLACYSVVHNEYQPMLQTIATIVRRISG